MTAAAMAARPRSTRRPRHGPLRRRRVRRGRASRPAQRRPYRPLDRRRRGRPLCRQVRPAAGPRRQGGAGQRRAAADAEDRQPTRAALPIEVFDGFRTALAANRAQFFLDVAGRPVLRLQPPGREGRSQGVIDNWWRQGMMGSAKAHYDGIKAFSETDQTEDLKAITVPTLVLHGDDDQIVPIADAGAAVGQAAEERHAEDLSGLPARHADDPCRRASTPTCWPSSRADRGGARAGRRVELAGTSTPTRRAVWQGRRQTSTSSTRFEVMSKRRKGFPSEARVMRGTRVVHGNKELLPREARAE